MKKYDQVSVGLEFLPTHEENIGEYNVRIYLQGKDAPWIAVSHTPSLTRLQTLVYDDKVKAMSDYKLIRMTIESMRLLIQSRYSA